MALNLPTFYKRTASAAVFAAVMLTGLLYNEWSFLALVALINFLCIREYFRLMPLIIKDTHWPGWLLPAMQVVSAAILTLYFLHVFPAVGAGFDSVKKLMPLMLFALPLLLASGALQKQTAVSAVMQAFGGLVYVTLPLMLLLDLRSHDLLLPIMLILMIWMNDTMAYLVGSFIGKTPFSPISPKKTWEGTAGGAVLAVVGAVVVYYYTHKFRLMDWVVLSLCAAIMGTIGDLLESKLKRLAEVKDSGAIMPGHGGALDRFDSLLLATPFAAAYIMLFW